MIRTADFGLVDVLAPGAAGTQRINLEVRLVDGNVDILCFRQHRDGRRRGVNAPRCFSVGHTLHAMHAGFVFELGKGATTADFGDDLLEAAHRAFA